MIKPNLNVRIVLLLSLGLFTALVRAALPARMVVADTQPRPPAARLCDDLPAEWTDMRRLAPGIVQEIRYATSDNFVKAPMYDCGRCFLRPVVAKALLSVHNALQKKGLGLKVFDCYRPRPFQQRLWDKVPDDRFVTPPAKGSMHSRGAAVDLTIVDASGRELDMGTPYDFFGPEAYHTYTKLSKTALANRRLLKTAMESAGFRHIRTEWWHYSYGRGAYPLSDRLWQCK